MATVLLAVIYAAFIGLGIPDSLFGAAWPAIYPDLGISVSLGSFYSVISSLATVASSLLSGRLIRRFGTGRVTAVSTALTAVGLLCFSLCDRLWLLCLCAIPLGLGAGAVDTALNNYVALHYNAGHMSFLHCFYGVGVTLSPFLMSFALSGSRGWRGGYGWMFVIQAVLTAVLFLSLPLWGKIAEKQEEAPAEQGLPLRQLLKQRLAGATLLVFFGSCVLESMCLGWGSTWLVNCRGASPARAAELITFYYVGMTLGRFLSGVIGRWLRPKQVLALGTGITCLAALLLFMPGLGVSTAGLFLIGLGNGPIFPNMTYLTPIHFGKEASQSLIGMQLAICYGAFLTTPLLFSLLTKWLGVGMFPVVCLGALVILAAALAAVARCTGRRMKT